jgi:ADP-glucose pyrophosphorylase
VARTTLCSQPVLHPLPQIDVPMSNCINSGISKIYILTQFNSTSLNRHLARTYK